MDVGEGEIGGIRFLGKDEIFFGFFKGSGLADGSPASTIKGINSPLVNSQKLLCQSQAYQLLFLVERN